MAVVSRRVPGTAARRACRHLCSASAENKVESDKTTESGRVEAQSDDARATATETGEEAQEPEDVMVTLAASEVSTLREDLAKAQQEVDEVKKKYMLQIADMENMRKRMAKQTDEARQLAIRGFAKSMIEVDDVLQLAVGAFPASELEGRPEGDSVRTMHEGVMMIGNVLQQNFNLHGLAQFSPDGAKFDPNMHEATFELDDDTKEAGTVADVVKKGYTIHGRTLRAAQVGVVRAK